MQLIEEMLKVRSGEICTLETLSIVKMNKRNNSFYNRVVKYVECQMQWGYNYQNATNNHLEKKGLEREFVADSLPFGEWVVPNKVITHKGESYLRFYTLNNNYNTKVVYFIDGREATKEEIEEMKPFLPKVAESQKQSEMGLDMREQVKPRTYKVGSIISIKVDGKVIENEEFVEVRKGVLK